MNGIAFKHVGALAMVLALGIGGPAVSNEQLRQNVENQLAEHSITVDNLGSLTNTQLAQIQLILNSSEGDCCKADMIESLVVEREPCEGTPQLRAEVEGQLKEHGIKVGNFNAIGGPEVVLMEAILTSNAPESEKAAQIERLIAEDVEMIGNDQLRADVEQCILRYNASVDDVNNLSAEQLVQIELIAGGSESSTDKKAMIEKIADQ